MSRDRTSPINVSINGESNIDINVNDEENINLTDIDIDEEVNMTVESSDNNIDFNVQDTGIIDFEMSEPTGTSDYNSLYNKPRINQVELVGNKTGDDLNLQEKGNYANTRVTNLEIDDLFR